MQKCLWNTLTSRVTLLVLPGVLLLGVACDNQINKHLKKDPYQSLFKKNGKTEYSKLPYQVSARVNMDTITETVYRDYLNSKYGKNPPKDKTRQESLNQVVNLYLLAQKARQLGYHKDPKVRDRLHFMAQSVLAKMYLDKLEQSIKITEQQLKDAYELKYLRQENIEYKTRHILVNTREQAVLIMREIANGTNFADLAKKFSKGPSRAFGGALEWFREDGVAKPFARAVMAMEPGETSRAPVKTEHGWHIILLEDRRKVPPPPYAEVHGFLYRKLKEKQIDIAIKRLRKRSNITLSTEVE